MVHNAVQNSARLDLAGPTHKAWNSPCAFPVGIFLTAKRSIGGVRPSVVLRAVISGIHHDGVVGDSQFVEFIEHLTDLLVMRDHTIAVVVLSAFSSVLGCKVSSEMTGG